MGNAGLSENGNLSESGPPAASHATDFSRAHRGLTGTVRATYDGGMKEGSRMNRKAVEALKTINRKYSIWLLTTLVLVSACSNSSELSSELTEVVDIWNDALYEGNIELARKHTSHTASEYLEALGGLEGLSEIYQGSRDNRPEHVFKELTIDGDVAHVKYISNYKDGSVKEYEDTLFREDGVWKVAPQHVTTR